MDPITIALGLGKLIPEVVGWIGGDDAEEVATKVVNTVESVTGVKGMETVSALEQNPELVKHAREQVIKELAIHAKDRASARKQQIALAKLKHASAWTPMFISMIVTIGFFGMLYVVFNQKVPDGSDQIANILLGVLGAGFTQVLNFWLGSSKSSQDKTALMGQPK